MTMQFAIISVIISAFAVIFNLYIVFVVNRVDRGSRIPTGCWRCNKSWRRVKIHDTTYKPGFGIFCLCEGCWEELATPEARMPYYERVLALGIDDPLKKVQVRAAVMNGG